MTFNIINNCHKSNESNLIESTIINNDTEVFLKDSIECSISTHTKSSTNILIPDSLNKQKDSQLIGNYTPISNTKNPLIIKKKLLNMKNLSLNDNTFGTKKIDYRYHPNYPMNVLDNIRIKKYYWLAVYDKLMKKKKIIKILNYFSDKSKVYEDEDIKEKIITLKDFDIFFREDSNKPYIKYSKGGCIFTKLYLLTLEEMKYVISYINHFEIKISPFLLETLQKKGSFQIIDNKKMNTNIIYCMGIYMNICIYSFSTLYDEINSKNLQNNPTKKYPESKKLVKLIKILMHNFPNYSIDFFICYLLSKVKHINYKKKSDEIKYILSNNASCNQNFNTNDTNNFTQKNKNYCFSNVISSLHTPYISIIKKARKIQQQNSFNENSPVNLCSGYSNFNFIKKNNTIITSKNKAKIKNKINSYDNNTTTSSHNHLCSKLNFFSKKNSNKSFTNNCNNITYKHTNNQEYITNSNFIKNSTKRFTLNSNRNTFSNIDINIVNKIPINRIDCPKNKKNCSYNREKKITVNKIKEAALTATYRNSKKKLINKGIYVVSRSINTQDSKIDDSDSFMEKYNIQNKKYMKNGVSCINNTNSDSAKNSEVANKIYETPNKKAKRSYYC